MLPFSYCTSECCFLHEDISNRAGASLDDGYKLKLGMHEHSHVHNCLCGVLRWHKWFELATDPIHYCKKSHVLRTWVVVFKLERTCYCNHKKIALSLCRKGVLLPLVSPGHYLLSIEHFRRKVIQSLLADCKRRFFVNCEYRLF